jgi:hypothetical protein
MDNDTLLGAALVAVGALAIVACWTAYLFGKHMVLELEESEKHVEHVCTGCHDATVNICGDLCPLCTYDADEATQRSAQSDWLAAQVRLTRLFDQERPDQ